MDNDGGHDGMGDRMGGAIGDETSDRMDGAIAYGMGVESDDGRGDGSG